MIRSKAIRNSARGETCTVNIAGVCNYDTATVVAAHIVHAGGKMGGKESDLSVCFSCSSCHWVIDNPKSNAEFEANRWFYLYRANQRTLERLVDSGVFGVVK